MSSHALPHHMHAALAHRWGSPEQIVFEQVPLPSPQNDEVLVRVQMVGLNAADKHMLSGLPYLVRIGAGWRTRKRPQLGQDVAGTVVAVGSGCTRFAVGDQVFGSAWGGVAEYAIAREARLCRKPDSVSWEHAAATPISGCTALQALDRANVTADTHVLIHGASGGVGTAAVQVAKARGAHVTATCGPDHVDLVTALGADRVAVYTDQDPLAVAAPYDAIIDVGGNLKNRHAVKALVPGGVLVKIGFRGGNVLGPMPQFLTRYVVNIGTPGTMQMMTASVQAEALQKMADLAEAGSYAPPVEHIYRFEDTVAAYQRLFTGHTGGKLIIQMA